MTKFFRDFIRDESGAAASEYILLLALLGAGVAAGALYFGGKVSAALTSKGDYLSACAADSTGGSC
uniref:Flp family type IVb pilin n=1 Tax=Altererythrobacter segetis TaxID=1104773 RepID=UPI00140E879C|nr:Flp family type IVb pilin [Altererythrobacter segetis]